MPKLGESHPIFAALWGRFGHRQVQPYRARVVGPAHGHVLELGAGTGTNLPIYRAADRITLTDPDPHMLRRAEATMKRAGLSAELVPAAAESLPFPDRSYDTVVATLVFCSVEDQAAALSEVRRVLKPGGTLRFMEHIRAEDRWRAWIQDVSVPLVRWFGGGCRPNRDTVGAIRRAGFELTSLKSLTPGYPLVAGVAAVY